MFFQKKDTWGWTLPVISGFSSQAIKPCNMYENGIANTFMSRKDSLFHTVLEKHIDICHIVFLYLKFCNILKKKLTLQTKCENTKKIFKFRKNDFNFLTQVFKNI